MDNKDILKAIQQARKNAKKRKFSQTIDLIINLQSLDIKKEDQKINAFVTLPHQRGKKIKIAALIGQELATKAKGVCDHIILEENFKSTDKKEIKKIASDSGFFIAQANIMPKIASSFGKILGPRGLMPNPKAGCVVPPTGELKPVIEKLQRVVHIQTKSELSVKAPVGNEDMKDEDILANAMAIYNNVLHSLPQEKNNIKNVMIKLTMGKPVIVGIKETPKEEVKK